MKSYNYYACVLDGEVYCNECLPSLSGIEPIFANSEWDCYPVCCECGEVHDYVILLTGEVT